MKSDRNTLLIYVVAGAAFAVAALPVFFEKSEPALTGIQPAATGPGGGAVVVGPQSMLNSTRSDHQIPHSEISPEKAKHPAPAVEIPAVLQEAIAEFEALAADAEGRSTLLREIARGWVGLDPVSGIVWTTGLDSGDCHLAFREILRHEHRLPDSFARDAFEILARSSGGNPRNNFLTKTALLRHWAEADPESAWERISGGGNATHLETVLSSWVETDPESVARELSQLPGTPDPESAGLLTPVYASTAREFAKTDPQKAVRWISDFPEGEARAAATASLIHAWIRQDPESASAWLNQQPAGPAKDAGITSLVLAIRHWDPEAAQIWAETMSEKSAGLRRNLLSYREADEFPAD